MFLVLASLIVRPVAFKYRSKRPEPRWRSAWDWALFAGGFIPALVFGVAVGNVLQGIPFRLDSDLRTTYEGTFLGLFTPFTLLCGLLSVAMLVLHGAAWLTVKAEAGAARERARTFGSVAALASIALFAGGWAFVAFGKFDSIEGVTAWPPREIRCEQQPSRRLAPGSATLARTAGCGSRLYWALAEPCWLWRACSAVSRLQPSPARRSAPWGSSPRWGYRCSRSFCRVRSIRSPA